MIGVHHVSEHLFTMSPVYTGGRVEPEVERGSAEPQECA